MLKLQPIIIWGASGHAAVVADILRLQGGFQIAGCVDDLNSSPRVTLAGQVIGDSHCLEQLRQQSIEHLIVGIGNNDVRCKLAAKAVALDFKLAIAVHPRATLAQGVTLGPGSVVMAGSVINPGATIGHNCIINTCASVDHDCQLGDGVHICPGAHLAGNVHVGDATMIGVGSAVRDGIRIGRHCIIGAGAAVVCDIPDGAVAVGVPARVIRQTAV